MNRRIFLPLIALVFLVGAFGCAHTIGQKPILTMEDVKSLSPSKLSDFAITLYNKRADWYKAQLEDPIILTEDQKKSLRKEYDRLKESWPFIKSYDNIVLSGGTPSESLQIELYKFIQKYLGGI